MTRTKASDEASELTAFLEFFFDNYMTNGAPVPPQVHPLKFVREMAERSPTRALLGLRIAIGD